MFMLALLDAEASARLNLPFIDLTDIDSYVEPLSASTLHPPPSVLHLTLHPPPSP